MPHYLYNCKICGETGEYVLPMPKEKEVIKPEECFRCGALPGQLERKFAGQTVSVSSGSTDGKGLPKGYKSPFVPGTEVITTAVGSNGEIMLAMTGDVRPDVQPIPYSGCSLAVGLGKTKDGTRPILGRVAEGFVHKS
jgi:predicted nucleic acid-binding Zn ribbon protein